MLFLLELEQKQLKIADKRLYVAVITSSTQDNAKILEQLKSGFKKTINWNKCQSKVSVQEPNSYLDYLIDPSFQGVNRLFVLLFVLNTDKTVYTGSYRSTSEKWFKNIW